MISFFRHHSLKQCQGLLVTFFRIFVKFLYSQLKQKLYSINFDRHLQSSQVKHTPQYAINEFIIQKFESLVHWRNQYQIQIYIPAFVMSSEFLQ